MQVVYVYMSIRTYVRCVCVYTHIIYIYTYLHANVDVYICMRFVNSTVQYVDPLSRAGILTPMISYVHCSIACCLRRSGTSTCTTLYRMKLHYIAFQYSTFHPLTCCYRTSGVALRYNSSTDLSHTLLHQEIMKVLTMRYRMMKKVHTACHISLRIVVHKYVYIYTHIDRLAGRHLRSRNKHKHV